MWLFWIVFQILLLVFVGGVVRSALRHSDAFFTAVIDRMHGGNSPSVTDSAVAESTQESDESQ